MEDKIPVSRGAEKSAGSHADAPAATWSLRLLYDGQCPFCRREIEWLKRRNRKLRITFEDISAAEFDPGRYGLTRDEVNRVLHGILPDGTVVRGMAAVRRAYAAIGLGWLTAPTGWPGMRWVADRMYAAFARNRLTLGQIGRASCRERV